MIQIKTHRIPRVTAGCIWLVLIVVMSLGVVGATAQDEVPLQQVPLRPARLIRIPLPITAQVTASVEQALQQAIEESSDVVRNEDRMTVVLEFDTSNNKTGQGSQLGSCLELARKMTSNEMNRLRTVAFIPPPSGVKFVDEFEVAELSSRLMGHAILVALAANELVISTDASIGNASVDEEKMSNLIREVYREIGSRRLTLPVPLVMAMVDPALELYRVNTDEGVLYVTAKELADLESQGKAIETNTLATAGQSAVFDGDQLVRYGLMRFEAETRKDLAERLKLQPDSLEDDPSLGRGWKAVEIQISDTVDSEFVDWTIRAVDQKIADNKGNLFILRIDSRVSDMEACLRLARHLAGFNASEVRTVAFVERYAQGGAGVLAVTCDHLLMKLGSTIGGVFEPALEDPLRLDAATVAESIAASRDKDTAVAMAMVDPTIEVMRYRQIETGQQRIWTANQHAELPQAEKWALVGPLDTLDGIPADSAEQLGIARRVINDFDQLKTFYQLQEDPKSIEPTLTDKWIKRVAAGLASPFVAPWLLFGAIFFLSTEMSAPGLGIPGFLGTVCVVLFFWSQYLDGNADWLEILLFAVGLIFIVIELVILPGFGIFGFGGIAMVIVSLVLASQTFVIPVTPEQYRRASFSLLTLVGAGAGFAVAMFALRNVIPNAPFFKQVMLQPPESNSAELSLKGDLESIVDWKYLEGTTGETVTKLIPSGKAKINGRLFDVISDGRMLEVGTKIKVVEVAGNRILVQSVQGEA